MNIQEITELDDEITKHNRIFQAGTQRRNVPNFTLAAELARSGKLGKLTAVHAGIQRLRDYKAPLPAQPEPDPSVVEWDKWVGPAPMLPYHQRYCRGGWRGHKGLYAAYYLPEWGSHTIDLCQWAAGMDGNTPVEYEARDATRIDCKYPNGVKLVMRLAGFKGEGDWTPDLGTCPIRFEGEEGWVEAGDNKRLVASNPEWLAGKKFDQLPGTTPDYHVRNFLDCVKTREHPSCNSTVARYGHMACFAAAASWKNGNKVIFDPKNPILPDHDETNSLQSYIRRAPYTI